MHAGQTLVLKDLQAAAQRLADTGCFETVRVDSTGAASALTVIFLLKPATGAELYRAEFENFVWFTPEELATIVHRSAPLFTNKLPETTGVLDAVSTGLQAALVSKGVPNVEVTHQLLLATSARPESTVAFHVTRPAVRLQSVTLDGLAVASVSLANRVEVKLRGVPYRSGAGPGTTADLFLGRYLDAGNLDARLVDVTTTPVMESTGTVGVDLRAHVVSGAVYRVANVTFTGTPIVSEQTFSAGVKLHAGDVASRSNLFASEAPVDLAYHRLGYMDEFVDATISEDEATHTVSYALKVIPGEVYRVKGVSVEGLSAEAKAEFDQAWTMKAGEIYVAEYAAVFLGNRVSRGALAQYAGGFKAIADTATHAVDLQINFVPLGKK